MRTPDVNVLLYAVNADSPRHDSARGWIEASFSRAQGIGFAWPALLGFLRLSTRHGIFAQPLAIDDALLWIPGMQLLLEQLRLRHLPLEHLFGI